MDRENKLVIAIGKGWEKCLKGVRRYKLHYKISKSQRCNVQHDNYS